MSLESLTRPRRVLHYHSPSRSVSKRRIHPNPPVAGSSHALRFERDRPITAPPSGHQSRRSVPDSHGKPVTIMYFDRNHHLQLDEKLLGEVLLKPEYKNHDVAVLAVVGAFRKGKSFLLNYILRYLRAGGASSWMGKDDDPLTGFSWRGGADRDTNGVIIWSRPFIIKPPADSGDPIALFVMDTQGTFDSSQTFRDCTVLFSMTTMVSSVLIYNIMHNIQQDDLLNLQFFTQYGRLVQREFSDQGPPFQDIIFLVRDWSYAYEKPYGYDGGDVLLKSRLITSTEHPEIKQLRDDLPRTFENIKCFLMPHPGLKVATSPDYDGRLSVMESDFKVYLESFIESVLNPSSLSRKTMSGSTMKCFELFHYFKVYAEACQSTEMPQPYTLLTAISEANHLSTLASAKDAYVDCMESAVNVSRVTIPWPRLRDTHTRCVHRALDHFDTRRKMGTEETTAMYREELIKYFHEEIFNYEERNRSKRLLGSFRTPAVTFVLAICLYTFGTLCHIIGLTNFAKLPFFLGHIVLITFILWLVSWYTGYMKRPRNMVDNVVDFSLSKLLDL